MKVVILGCGRVGARVATYLSDSHDVTIIDWNPASFDRLGEEFSGRAVIGNGIDVDVLRGVGTEEADVFIAVTDGDNRNLMAAQIARHLGANRVVVRVYDVERSQIFGQMGLVTISPTITGAERLHSLVLGRGEE